MLHVWSQGIDRVQLMVLFLFKQNAANAHPVRRSFAEPRHSSDFYIHNNSPVPNHFSSYTPSSMVTFLHHGFSPLSANISSASPTCRLSLTSLLTCPLSLSRMALSARKLLPLANLPLCASPRDADPDPERISSLETQPPSLVTGNCYCKGSEEELRRLRWR